VLYSLYDGKKISMIPLELKEEILTLPDTDNHSIVIITGNGLRHKRFAYRLQKEFGDMVVAWYEVDSSEKAVYTCDQKVEKGRSQQLITVKNDFRSSLKKIVLFVIKEGVTSTISRCLNYIMDRKGITIFRLKAEEDLFGKEIEELKAFSVVKPKKINPLDIVSNGFADEIKKINPYFFLTLGGSLYPDSLLKTVKGIAINQHAGHAPMLKGSNTTEWALYYRNINYVSSTVHITTSGADAGPILRRSSPCMFPTDSCEKVFARVVALGTELMIEVVHDIIKDKQLPIFKQTGTMGKTYVKKDFTHDIRKRIARDFRAGWLRNELLKIKDF